MKVAIVYDSARGTTRQAAEIMGRYFDMLGHEATVRSVRDARPEQLAAADLICVGSWTQGLFVVRQHATEATLELIDRLGDLGGKRAVVFCTYKLATGPMLQDMAARLRAKGADVVGQFKFLGKHPTPDFREFVRRLPVDPPAAVAEAS